MLASCTGSAADLHLAPRRVDDDLADPQRAGAAAGAAAEHRPDPGDDLATANGLTT